MHEDTIFAVASGAGRAAIAAPRAERRGQRDDAARAGRPPAAAAACQSAAAARRAARNSTSRALGRSLPAPASYTGEDAAELGT